MSETSSDDMLQSINAAPRRSEGVRPQGGLPAQTTGLKQCQKTLSRRRQILKSATSSWCSCCQRIHSTERVRSLTHIIYIKKKRRRRLIDRNLGTFPVKPEDVVFNYVWCGVEFCEQSHRFRFSFWPDENVLLSLEVPTQCIQWTTTAHRIMTRKLLFTER